MMMMCANQIQLMCVVESDCDEHVLFAAMFSLHHIRHRLLRIVIAELTTNVSESSNYVFDNNRLDHFRIMKPIVDDDCNSIEKRRYYCCCCCCHVRTGAIIIGGIEFVYLVYQLVSTSHLFANVDANYHTFSFIVTLFGIALGSIAIALLFVGVVLERPYLLIPHLLMQVMYD